MRLVACALLLGAAALGGDRALVEFRLRTSPDATLRGWASAPDDEGFRFQRLGARRVHRIEWADVRNDDRADLRRRLGLAASAEESSRIAGHRVHFRGDGEAVGLLVRVDHDGRHWLKREGILYPYPRDRIERIDDVEVDETQVYDAEELYWRRVRRTPPRTAAQHRDLADRLVVLGNFTRALEHYREALLLEPSWHPRLAPRVAAARVRAKDIETAALFRRIRTKARLHKDFDGARTDLDRWLAANPDRRRTALQLRDEIEELRARDIETRFHAVKNEELRALVDRYVRKHPDYDAALSWATARLPALLRARLAARLDLPRARVAELLETRSRGAPHWTTYHDGTFAVSKRARRGSSTKRRVRGDPSKWWARNPAEMRGGFLRAYAVERLPELFEVVEVRLRDCSGCGGTGSTRHASVHPLAGGGHEWRELCRRCYGARRDRAVSYR